MVIAVFVFALVARRCLADRVAHPAAAGDRRPGLS
jgi:hypothetical protein